VESDVKSSTDDTPVSDASKTSGAKGAEGGIRSSVTVEPSLEAAGPLVPVELEIEFARSCGVTVPSPQFETDRAIDATDPDAGEKLN
jgi:hypothetical protein